MAQKHFNKEKKGKKERKRRMNKKEKIKKMIKIAIAILHIHVFSIRKPFSLPEIQFS